MSNRIRLSAGRYTARTALCLSLYQGEQHKEYREVKAGETFEVPEHVNGFWHCVEYHPDFGDERPEFERIDS